jgi:uncharacterized protein YjbI with pentapeptide repeats
MANQDQLDILGKGVDVWNQWRRENESVTIDLSQSDLMDVDLNKVNLSNCNLYDTDFSGAKLKNVNFRGANLVRANLSVANLSRANLDDTNLTESNLSNANLKEASLRLAYIIEANLQKANFTGVTVVRTAFASVDLSEVIGLDEVRHESQSPISTNTIQLSKGKIPESFLRGCGLPDWEIESAKLYTPNLSNEEINKIIYRIYDLRATQSIQISPLFISYSHRDNTFVDKLEKSLISKGVRFWRDSHDMTAGKIETQIDRAIHQNPIVLLILSKNSMNSDWVQHEVRKARELEKELGRDALCPIALDDGWKSSRWPQRVMEQVMEYNILDFSKWEDESTFQAKFVKLLSGLDLFYKKPEK